AEKGIEKSYAEVIAHKDLSALYALEGISPPQPIRPDIDAFLITERQAIPELEGTYQLPYSFIHKKPTFIQLRISNIGEGIAFNVECRFIPNSSIKLHSMYSHRIIDQLTYQSTIIETFKVEPLKKGKIQFPATTITYQSFDRQQYQKIVPSKDILVQ
ncbi:MAG: hypothetical protein U9O98_02835, partial [Asgard group archaeon]|nr:hypothetical protein [Asgard group archaeon]